jgi:hypothetical protein
VADVPGHDGTRTTAPVYRHAVFALGDGDAPDAVRLSVALSSNAMYLGDFDAMLAWAREAERVAALVDDEAPVVAARTAIVNGAAYSGEVGTALELHRSVGPMVDSLADVEVADDLGGLCSLASAEMYLDRYRDAVAHARRGLDLARSTGQSNVMPFLSPIFGTGAWMIGEMTGSASVLDDAIEAARLVDDGPPLAWHLFNRATSGLMSGDVATALSTSDESFELVEAIDAGIKEDIHMQAPDIIVGLPFSAVTTAATAVFSNSLPPESLHELVGDIAPRATMLIWSRRGNGEKFFDPAYYDRAGEPKTTWEIPERTHINGFATRPDEYERRVLAFFEQSLT